MKRLLALLSLLALPAAAADLITLSITVTNATTNGDYLTINGVTRTWTNTVSSSPSTLIATHLQNQSAPNLYLSASAYRWNYLNPSYGNTNVVKFIALPGDVIAYTISGAWASGALTTNTTAENIAVRVPLSSETLAQRTNIMSDLAANFLYSTSQIPVGVTALYGAVQTNGNQTITGAKTFTGTINGTVGNFTNGMARSLTIASSAGISGTVSNLTNGTFRQPIFISPYTTNPTNYGLAISSPGTMVDSEQFGSGSLATNYYALAIGFNATAGGESAQAVGNLTYAIGTNSLAVGYNALAEAFASTAIGALAHVDTAYGIGIGAATLVQHSNSVAIGTAAETTAADQIVLGNSSHTVTVPGLLTAAAQTNSEFKGTNMVNGDIGFTRLDVTTAAAGNNVIDPGTEATYLRIDNNPGAAFTIAALDDGRPGRILIVENDSGYTMTIAHESGYTATAADRIITPVAADVTVTGHDTALLIYSGSDSRWILIHPRGDVVNSGAQVLGVGTDYSLTATMTNVDFGTTDPSITLPAAGTYRVEYQVAWDSGATASDIFKFAIWEGTSARYVPGSFSRVGNWGASLEHALSRSAIYAATNAATLTLHAINEAGARGTVTSTNTSISYVRLY